MMPIEKYTEFISKMDIGFFIMNRQQAIGNIFMMLANGCKVYLRKNSQMDEYITKSVSLKQISRVQPKNKGHSKQTA